MNLKEWSLAFAWLVALAGTLMSLFYSVVAASDPCSLCWYQRIALFPLCIQLGIAAYRHDRHFALYAYPLCFFGFATALYQSFLPVLPSMQKSCGLSGNCVSHLPHLFGVPFPWISAIGFLLIMILIRFHRSGAAEP